MKRDALLRRDVLWPSIELDWFTPLHAQIAPSWIGRDDEFQFADAQPAFELFFPGNRRRDGSETLEIDELVNVVSCGVAVGIFLLLVLLNPYFDLGSYADVELLETVGECRRKRIRP